MADTDKTNAKIMEDTDIVQKHDNNPAVNFQHVADNNYRKTGVKEIVINKIWSSFFRKRKQDITQKRKPAKTGLEKVAIRTKIQ